MVEKNFQFSTAGNIIFKVGGFKNIETYLRQYGKRLLFLYSERAQIHTMINENLSEIGYLLLSTPISGEPTEININDLLINARKHQIDVILAVGGGSVIDTGKVLSALITNKGNLMDYLEVVGRGQQITEKPIPYIAVPTTAGTGSEVTKNAVIKIVEKNVKVSMRHNWLLPEIALIDPQLTYSLPPQITANTGMDAFIQVIEPYVSNNPNDFVDLFCIEGIKKAAQNIVQVYTDGGNHPARIQMSWVSLLGGLSLANSTLGAVHGFAGPIGGLYDVPHGLICAALLPSVFEVNVRALQMRDRTNPVLFRYQNISRWVTNNKNATIGEGVEWFKELNKTLQIPRLKSIGIKKEDFLTIIEQSKKSSSMQGNSIKLNEGELFDILENS